MDAEAVQSFYENMGFELVEIDDRETLFYELSDLGDYATITDPEGNLPGDLESPVIWSVYDENDSFQWSVTIEDSHYLRELFNRIEGSEELLSNLQDLRQDNITKAAD